MLCGDDKAAIRTYRNLLELDPGNDRGKEFLTRLEAEEEPLP